MQNKKKVGISKVAGIKKDYAVVYGMADGILHSFKHGTYLECETYCAEHQWTGTINGCRIPLTLQNYNNSVLA